MRRALLALLVLVRLALAGGTAHAERVIAVAPLSTLGSEDASATTKDLTRTLETALAALPDTRVIPAAQVAAAITKAKQPRLRTCDGDAACLVAIGALLGAQVVVAGELGGLGEAQVVYLEAIDVPGKRELRSTTMGVSSVGTSSISARGAAIQLLAPERYVGQLHLTIDAPGATVYVNGNRIGISLAAGPMAAVPLPVGTHAVRVTHPEYRDFVRFVDIGFDQTAEVQVGLQQFPIVERDVTARARPRSTTIIAPATPWYRRWGAVAGGAVILGVVTAIVVGATVDGTHVDASRPVGD